MKTKLKPPGTKPLKLKCYMLPSTSAFKFNLRRYKKVGLVAVLALMPASTEDPALQARKTVLAITLVLFVTLLHFYAAPFASNALDNMMSATLLTEFVVLFSGRGLHSFTF
jgi:hypothetical protein